MRFFTTIALSLATSIGFCQIDTIFVSTGNVVYIDSKDKILILETGNDDYKRNITDNLGAIQAKTTSARTTSLMVKTMSTVKVWIIKYKAHPKRLLWSVYETNVQPEVMRQNEKVIDSQTGTSPHKANNTSTITASIEKGKSIVPENTKIKILKPDKIEFIPEGYEGRVASVLKAKRSINDIGFSGSGIYLTLNNIFIDDRFFYLVVGVYNTSQIAFQLDFTGLEHRSANVFGRKKQTAESEIFTPSGYSSTTMVLPDTEVKTVYFFNTYAYNENDRLIFKITESNGDRVMEFVFTGKDMIKGKRL